MIKRRSLLFFFSLIFVVSAAFIPGAADPLDDLVSSLKKWSNDNPQEKVYLHMDKPYYALGDTIWFKGYVTVGSRHQLSALSGSLYVDLITEKDSIVSTLKLPVTAGMAMGDFTLHNELREGNYRIRAYTQWMRNAGEEYFFEHTFTVGTPASDDVIASADYGYVTINNKPVLTTNLKFSNEQGTAITAKDVQYEVFIDNKRVWGKSSKTDEKGNLSFTFSNDKQVDLRGAFIRTVIETDGKVKVVKDLPIKAGFANTDVQFFPESGNLINGITSRVAFKAVGVDGLGVNIKGIITDEQNNEVTTFETLNAGMGSFLLKPESGKIYSAKISFADGSVQTLSIPKSIEDGYVLSVYQPNADSILVRIYASKTKVDQSAQTPTHVNLIVQSSGETVLASPLKISRSSNSFWLEKKQFPSGIAQFTLFDAAGEPLNERLAFIKSNDRMQLNVKTAKASYKSRERVQVDLEALTGMGRATAGNFSVSVVDESKVPLDEAMESTIFSNLLLTSDLKGYVEKPNYYFNKETDEVNRALDNLMLTQGYRRFSWKEIAAFGKTTGIAASDVIKPRFEAEGLGISLSGKVLTLGGKPVANANVLMMAMKAGAMKTDTTDLNGRFMFDKIFLTDSIGFSIQARLGKSSKLEVVLDTIPKMRISKNKNIAALNTNIAGTLKAYIENGKKLDNLYERTGQLDKVQRLKEVEIRARKPKGLVYAQQGPLRVPEGHADQTFIMKNPEEFPTLGIGLQGRLGQIVFRSYQPENPGVTYLNYPYSDGAPINVIMDGRKLTPDQAGGVFDGTELNAEDVVKIEVVNKSMSMMSILSGAAILIYTKTGTMGRRTYNPSIVNITPKGFNKAREYYAPRYDRPGSGNALPDLRSTIHWNPNVKTYSTGKTTFDYFNADGPGNYKVIIEGINAEGEIGRAVYRYKVEQGDAAIMAIADIKGEITPVLPVKEDVGLLALRNALDTIRKSLPVEKIFVHTDKPYYNIGDTLWFKSYVTDESLNLSKQSSLLYLELGDDSTQVVRRISIPLKDGLGWAQIPLDSNIFHEGGYTLRAYTNWMQNFGDEFIFKKRFYLGVPVENTWLVKSEADIVRVNDKDELQVNINLRHVDKSTVGLRDVEVKIFEGKYYMFKEKMQTTLEGNLKFSKVLKAKADGRNIRVEIRNLHKADGKQLLQVPLNINRNKNIDVQFLPEGGHLVAGLKSRIGFKAIGESGLGTDVSGIVINKSGIEVAKFETLHNGMGSFDFVPELGEVYAAKLVGLEGNQKAYVFPKVEPRGTVLGIINERESDVLKVSVADTKDEIHVDSNYYLVGISNGKLLYSNKIVQPAQLEINKSIFPTGVTRLTLLKGKVPLNERVVYVDHQDQLAFNVTTNKSSYLKRDSVEVMLEVKDKNGMPVKGNFSISITDNTQVKPDTSGNSSIAASLLINSALKGYVESPGYYLDRKQPNHWRDLDNLMLTQGWVAYSWKDIFSVPVAKFVAEKELRITGVVTNLFNKPMVNVPVLISSQKPTFITTTYTDVEGRYLFKNLPRIDSGSFFIQARTAKGKELTTGGITVQKFIPPAFPSMIRSAMTPWYVNTEEAQINYVQKVVEKQNQPYFNEDGIMLKEVKIERQRLIVSPLYPKGKVSRADLIFDERDIKES
ncbi:MAG: hypothetical protein EOO92_08510, partial [Pedobacter sp.]